MENLYFVQNYKAKLVRHPMAAHCTATGTAQEHERLWTRVHLCACLYTPALLHWIEDFQFPSSTTQTDLSCSALKRTKTNEKQAQETTGVVGW
jgi:hypothetical protein